jgi:hypothetical protein
VTLKIIVDVQNSMHILTSKCLETLEAWLEEKNDWLVIIASDH